MKRAEFIIPCHYPTLQLIHEGESKYVLVGSADGYSKRYNKWIHLPDGFLSDGATGARDIRRSWAWLFHDKLCNDCCWEDGSPVTAWQASIVLNDILEVEGHEVRDTTWKWATFLLGSWKIKRKVGWFL